MWVSGRWDWLRREHRWDWVPGHWERERRGQKWRDARWDRRGDEWVLVDGGWIQAEIRPTAAPPPPREERITARPGFVFVRGRWDWKDGNWVWLDGHWERERRGRHWREARWEQRDGVYVLNDGGWDEAPRLPTAAPPPPREERIATRPGFVFVRGRWDWRDGNWIWLAGHWERERARQRWVEGRWELRGDHWEWIDGSWGAPPEYPPIDQPPPPPRREDVRLRPGEILVPGYWAWQAGQYVWQPPHGTPIVPGSHFEIGRWTQAGDHWVFVNGRWVVDAAPPPPAAPPRPIRPEPPPPRDERIDPRPGYVFARGHFEWRGDRYEWMPGHWERARAQMTWRDGRWEQRGNEWIYIEGGWQ